MTEFTLIKKDINLNFQVELGTNGTYIWTEYFKINPSEISGRAKNKTDQR